MRSLLPLLIAACTGTATIDDSPARPAETDTDVIAGEPITISRDGRGVPHVHAATDLGAFYGLGWVHAQDRLLQMNAFVWSVQGRMAEAVGPEHLEADRERRILGTWRHAQAVAEGLPAEHRALLQAFADGVNDRVAQHPEDVHPLFAELGMEPEVWTPAHSLAAWWRMGDFFSGNGFGKAAQYYAFEDLEAELGTDGAIAATLAGRHPGDPDAAVVQEEDVPADVKAAILSYAESLGYGADEGFTGSHPKRFAHPTPHFSHAWAVGGARTTTGRGVVVSDPQVTVMWPNLMYEWQARGESFNARGIGAAGSAGLLIGFNEDVAWGMTASGGDLRDLFRLEMTGPDTYTIDGEEHRLETRVETLKVEGRGDETLTWRGSAWGPVVTELTAARRGDEFALKGVPYSETDRDTFVGMVAMMRARSIDDLHRAVDDWRHPSANLVAADRDGDVYYTLLGAIPVRSALSPLGGMIAQEGDSRAYDHQDIIPADFKPWVRNPPSGYVFSANHRVEDGWYPLPLGLGQGSGGHTARSRRLGELLAELPDRATPQQILDDVQLDCTNSARRDMAAVLRHVALTQGRGAVSADAQRALSALQPWLGSGASMATDSPGVFLASKIATNFRPHNEFPELGARFGGGESGMALMLTTHLAGIAADRSYRVDADSVAWLDRALANAWRAASAESRDPADWDARYARSGAVNKTLVLFGSDMAGLGSRFDGGASWTSPTLACGDGQTIQSQGGQTYTHFVPLGEPDGAMAMIPPGNVDLADHPASTVQGEAWAAGDLFAAPLTEAGIAAHTTVEVVLRREP